MASKQTYEIQAIGSVISPFKEKFGLPRQPGLITSLSTQIEIFPPFDQDAAFEGLEQSSHIWVHGLFNDNLNKPWKPRVRPPRLGGNQSLGVFATRAPVRPNGISLSVVKLHSIQRSHDQRLILETSCIDMIDGTPIIDIKPYIPYCDALQGAQSQLAPDAPQQKLSVSFESESLSQLTEISRSPQYSALKEIIDEMLSLDPRPAYHSNQADRVYKLRLYEFDLHFVINDHTQTCTVLRLSMENP